MYSLKNKPISILIVEDNELDALIVQTLLQPHFNIEMVKNGSDALAIIEDIKFDFILMDLNLGNDSMNGVKLMQLIRDMPKHKDIKIFAVTAYTEDEELIVKKGFDEIFIKPVIKEEIFEFINKSIMHNSAKL